MIKAGLSLLKSSACLIKFVLTCCDSLYSSKTSPKETFIKCAYATNGQFINPFPFLSATYCLSKCNHNCNPSNRMSFFFTASPKHQMKHTCVRKSLICAFAIAFIISVMLIAANQMLRRGMK